jgi:transcriptional regulator with XRE-family HTH domain
MRKTLRSPDHKALLDLLVAARKKAGLTQAEVAKKLRRPQSFVAKYENGERRLDIVEFVELSRALDADPVAMLRAFVKTMYVRGITGAR